MKTALDEIIELLLLIQGSIGFISAVMWTITEPQNRWLWFSRFAFGVICFGLLGIIRAIRSKS